MAISHNEHGGPTQSLSSGDEWQPNWPGLADQIVNKTLAIGPDDRVIYMVDPYLVPELFEEVRRAVLRAGAVEQATIVSWTEGLAKSERDNIGRPRAAEARDREEVAHRSLFETATAFMWLPTSFYYPGAVTTWETERILTDWKGRGIHFHWFPEPGTLPGDAINVELQKIYSRAILDLDYGALGALQRRLAERLRGQRLHVTRPDGTDLTMRLDPSGWYHLNDGDASPGRVKETALHARDLEQELPCGAVRMVPVPDSVEGVLSLRGPVAYNGYGLPLSEWWDNLDFVFSGGRISKVSSATHQADVDRIWNSLGGDKDRLGEIVIGTNPLLEKPEGASMPTYWGFGAGKFRFHLGENVESGGSFVSDLWLNIFAEDVTVHVDGETLIQDGELVFA